MAGNLNTSIGNGAGGNDPCVSPDKEAYWASTEVELESFQFLWTLNDYRAFTLFEDRKFRSPIFLGGPRNNHSWQLELCAKNRYEEDETEYLSIHLYLTGFGDGSVNESRKVQAWCHMTILDADGQPGHENQFTQFREFQLNSCWGWAEFIRSSDLISPEKRLLVDECLKIRCCVTMGGDLKHKVCNRLAVTRTPSEEKMKRRRERLSSDFGRLYKDGFLTDVEINCKKTIFKAHKAVLVARSSVFAAMFSVDMMEKSKNSVEILDFDADVVKGMLEYLYSGETEMMAERAPELLQIAEKYDLAGLKEDCEGAIAENLNSENAAKMLVIAHLYSAPFLKPRVIDYIKCNKDEVRNTKSFHEMARAHPNVFLDLIIDLGPSTTTSPPIQEPAPTGRCNLM